MPGPKPTCLIWGGSPSIRRMRSAPPTPMPGWRSASIISAPLRSAAPATAAAPKCSRLRSRSLRPAARASGNRSPNSATASLFPDVFSVHRTRVVHPRVLIRSDHAACIAPEVPRGTTYAKDLNTEHLNAKDLNVKDLNFKDLGAKHRGKE